MYGILVTKSLNTSAIAALATGSATSSETQGVGSCIPASAWYVHNVTNFGRGPLWTMLYATISPTTL